MKINNAMIDNILKKMDTTITKDPTGANKTIKQIISQFSALDRTGQQNAVSKINELRDRASALGCNNVVNLIDKVKQEKGL
jgi:hypothetical protein